MGETLEVVVLEIDAENRRLALSHKHLETNPWDTFETIFTLGSVHKGLVLNKTDKNAVLELPYGVEGIVSMKNLVKQDGSMPEVGESLDFKVIKFAKDEKKIELSHVKTYSEPAEEIEDTKKKKGAKGGEPVKNIEAMSSLGEHEALSELKSRMESSKEPAPTTVKEEKTDEKPKRTVKAKKAEASAEAESVVSEETKTPKKKTAPKKKKEESSEE